MWDFQKVANHSITRHGNTGAHLGTFYFGAGVADGAGTVVNAGL